VDNLDNIAEQLRRELTARDDAREKLLPLCREAIRYSSNAIRAVHRQEIEKADELLQTARRLLDEAGQIGEYRETGGASVLVTMDFPDAITGGLRRTTDMVRGVLEKTRSDLTLAIRQKELESRLAELQGEGIAPAALSPVGSQPEKAEVVAQEVPPLDSREQEIYKALAAWRTRKSNEENLAPFIIAHNSVLNQVIRLHPKTLKDLNAVKGFGERRINKYGKEIIAIVNKERE
jgi:superfamily II DNA helicase RecQ